MRKSLFSAVITICVIAAIAYGVLTNPPASGWFWPHVGWNLIYGEIGLAIALALTFPILRRVDLVLSRLALGAIVIPILGFLPSLGYTDIQLFRDGTRSIAAAELAKVEARPVLAKLSGVWRYDLAATGTYIATRGPQTRSTSKCTDYEVHFCRVPIVASDWQPGQPVLAVAACDKPGTAATREQNVRLIPARDPAMAIYDFERADAAGKQVYFGACSQAPATGHADLGSAAFHFDADHGFLVMPAASGRGDQQSIVTIECLFALAALAFALRRGNWKTRVAKRGEVASKRVA